MDGVCMELEPGLSKVTLPLSKAQRNRLRKYKRKALFARQSVLLNITACTPVFRMLLLGTYDFEHFRKPVDDGKSRLVPDTSVGPVALTRPKVQLGGLSDLSDAVAVHPGSETEVRDADEEFFEPEDIICEIVRMQIDSESPGVSEAELMQNIWNNYHMPAKKVLRYIQDLIDDDELVRVDSCIWFPNEVRR
jgi:hypothetical protein